jgi:creatinine amidohydrolase
MRNSLPVGVTLAILAVMVLAPDVSGAATTNGSHVAPVEFELMTWPEVKAALAAGKNTALIYTGGVEQRGPQNVNGGHNIMGHAVVKEIALRLGNAIVMPILPLTPNKASAEFPGTIGLTNELLEAVLTRMVEETVVTGFKNVVVMGDHGGGQSPDNNVYQKVATTLNEKYSAQGVQVFYCDQVYKPAISAFLKKAVAEGYPNASHAGIDDTSLMMYLDKDGTYVRKALLPTAVGIPVDADGKPHPAADSPRNGIMGDARRSSAKLGKELFELKVSYAVKQIQQFIPPQK